MQQFSCLFPREQWECWASIVSSLERNEALREFFFSLPRELAMKHCQNWQEEQVFILCLLIFIKCKRMRKHIQCWHVAMSLHVAIYIQHNSHGKLLCSSAKQRCMQIITVHVPPRMHVMQASITQLWICHNEITVIYHTNEEECISWSQIEVNYAKLYESEINKYWEHIRFKHYSIVQKKIKRHRRCSFY